MDSPSSKQKPSFTLTATSPLNSHRTIVNGASLVEVTTQSIVSVSPFIGSEALFNVAIAKLFNDEAPSATKAFERTGKKACLLLPSSQNQWFLCFKNEAADPLDTASSLLGKGTSTQLAMTNQSDAWAILVLAGPLVYRTLERICLIDFSASAMPVGTTARTVIEHLGAIILRRPDDSDGNPRFWLLSARSSAASFLHVIIGSPPFTAR